MNFEGRTIMRRPPSIVFAVLADLEKLPLWEGSFLEVKPQFAGPIQIGSVYWCKRKQPRIAESRMVVTEYEQDRRLMIEGDWVGFLKPVFGYVLEPVEEGTNVILVTHSQLRGIITLFTPLLTLLGKRLSATYMHNLQQLVESA